MTTGIDDAPAAAAVTPAHGVAAAPDLAVKDLLRADPVGHGLLVRGRLRFMTLAAVCLALLTLLLVVLPILFPRPGAGLMPRPEEFFATLDGSMMLVSWLIFVPVIWGFYAWQPAAIARLHARLNQRVGREAADTSALGIPDWYNKPLWTALAALLTAWILYRFTRPAYSFSTAGPWIYESHAGVQAAFLLLVGLTYYMMTLLVIRQFIAIISINRTFERERIPIRFLHPDRCGGLGFLGEHAFGIAPLIAAAGLNISLGYVRLILGIPLGSDTAVYTLIALTALYLLGSIAAFVALLWSAHRQMVSARDAWLDDIARGFDLHQGVVQQEMRGGHPDPESVARLEAARRAWDIGRSLPTWPINTGTVRQFSAALLSPFGPIGIAAIQRWLG